MKTHLLDSCEPITEGRTQTAICGATVKDAAFVFMWDDIATGGKMTFGQAEALAWKVCKKCRETHLSGRYIYGITDGQNAKSGEREAAV